MILINILYGEFKRSRMAKVFAYRVMLLISILRFTISALMNDQMVSRLMADPSRMLGNPYLTGIFVTSISKSFFAVTTVMAYQEIGGQFPVLEFFSAYRRRSASQLNRKNTRRLALIINLMAKLLFYYYYWFLIFVIHILFTIVTFKAYWNYQDNLSLLLLLIWSVFLYFALIQFLAVAFGGVVLSSFCALYLTYKFNEVTNKIYISKIFQDTKILKLAIKEHHMVAKQTKQLNQFFSPILFILYFMNTTPLVILIYLVNHEQTTHIGKIIFLTIFIVLFLCTCLTNWLCSRISHSARGPYPLLNNILSNSNKFSINNRLKIQNFIEKTKRTSNRLQVRSRLLNDQIAILAIHFVHYRQLHNILELSI